MTLFRLFRSLLRDFFRLRRAHAALKSRVRRLLLFDRTGLAELNQLLLQAQRQRFGRGIGMRAVGIDRDGAGQKAVVYSFPVRVLVQIRPS
ncbi:MAG: hypothetical protein KatS3mg005_2060 [Bryobacteraceae bacterium]|nr:MAG: hypothetical protein KatS3mg005_2060 [Bryobacteraceae bacterium]